MCGITGIISFESDLPIQSKELERMAAVLAHRGPDDSGVYLDPQGHCGLANRRLAVIDIKGGHQPLSNEDQTLWITYNGQCYNFEQLRKDLIAQGHRFQTRCDTEVIVHLYEQYGPDCVNHIRGMFAFAIWDTKKKQLFLARDRMGQKPLYYGFYRGRLVFASQCNAILQSDRFPRRPDHAAISQYLLLQYVPFPASGFKDIHQLPPAHVMTIDASNIEQPKAKRYWSLGQAAPFRGTFTQAKEQLHSELTEATRLRLISDVPLGAFLSGGIDSTIIVGLMSQFENDPIKACTIGFTEKKYNELPDARLVAKRYNCDHKVSIVQADCHETIDELTTFYDEPFADSSALPTFLLSQLARKHVTVALTGDGGDECFGGYDRYRALNWAQRIQRSKILNQLLRCGCWKNIRASEHRSRRRRLQRFMTAASMPIDRCYLKWLSVFDPDMLTELLRKENFTDRVEANGWNTLAAYFKKPNDPAGQAMIADGSTYLPGDLNTKADRASMAVGLELRSPFQDHKVVELAYSLPTRWRVNGLTNKYILRKTFRSLIPPPLRRRPKRGFGVPMGRWFRHELRERFIDTVLSRRALERGYFNQQAIENLLAENDQRRQDHGHRLWSLLMLELWHRKYIDTG
ncbi:MAG: asparagine synthase (glutamine-hydrolyzing) [Planctomycetes bacterium]|nr:asparagine synthase (glutamine-hydrolyzing) [Planctomycetota bacterium]